MSTHRFVTERPVRMPCGFRAGAAAAGLKANGTADLALFAAEESVPCAGVFTRSVIPAAPVRYCRERLRNGCARAVFTNAGIANAATGTAGMQDTCDIAAAVADGLGCDPEDVLVCSTGVIGRRVDVARVREHIPQLVDGLDPGGLDAAATAIHTTDTRRKEVWLTLPLDGVEVQLVGVCKGAAMIGPNMATMLAYLFTDAAVEPAALQAALSAAVANTFNAITVDGDTSTNDTVLAFASGAVGHDPVTRDAPGFAPFAAALEAACDALARQIVLDAEGATKLVELQVEGASTAEAALHIGLTVANSPLVKTALFGADPNYGRLVMAVGKAGIPVDEAALGIRCGETPLLQGGEVVAFDEAAVRAYLAGPDIRFHIVVGSGPGAARVLTCDLTSEYVRLNAEYTT